MSDSYSKEGDVGRIKKRVVDRKSIEEQVDALCSRSRPFTQLPLKNRIRTILSLYAWDELLELSEKAGTPALWNMRGKRSKKEVAPGIMVGDLILLRLVSDATSGSDSAAKLLFSYGYGNPETAVTLSLDGDGEEEFETIDISTEEKIEILRKFDGKTIDVKQDDVSVEEGDVGEARNELDFIRPSETSVPSSDDFFDGGSG